MYQIKKYMSIIKSLNIVQLCLNYMSYLGMTIKHLIIFVEIVKGIKLK